MSSPSAKNSVSAIGLALLVLILAVLIAVNLIYYRPRPTRKTVKAQNNITGLLQAIEGFHSTYNALPKSAPAGGELTTDGDAGVALLIDLLGKQHAGRPMDNPKQIRFVNTQETKRRERGGLLYPPNRDDAPPIGLYDPWGNPFRMRFAPEDGSGIQDPFQPDQRIQGKAVIVFSYGPNGKPDAKDDLKSW